MIAVAHPKWGERPVAVRGARRRAPRPRDEELREWLEPRFAKYWLPDAYVRLQQIPRTATGKFLKAALREQLKDFQLP